jgi:holo-[acyl-carrier protein] synthase
VFTRREASYCRAAASRAVAARFAARFAAKEAVIKALGPERPWTDWRAIEVRRHASGRCAIALHGEAALLSSRRRVHHLAVSLSHDGDRAAAFAVALCAIPARSQEPGYAYPHERRNSSRTSRPRSARR